jgi:hypothetical protein
MVENGRRQSIPSTGHGEPYGYGMLRQPYFLESMLTDGGDIVTITY